MDMATVTLEVSDWKMQVRYRTRGEVGYTAYMEFDRPPIAQLLPGLRENMWASDPIACIRETKDDKGNYVVQLVFVDQQISEEDMRFHAVILLRLCIAQFRNRPMRGLLAAHQTV